MEQPSYYAILTADVRYDSELAPNEKLFFAEITALSNKNGYCNAFNSYFANLYKVNKNSVSRWLNKLKKKGYVKVEIERDSNKKIISRKIYPINNNVNTLSTKKLIGIHNNVKGNTTRYNTTSVNNIEQKEKEDIEKQVEKLYLEHYPRKQGKAKGIKKALNAIMNEETNLNDLKTCIKNYANEVKDREEKYIKHFSTFMNGDYADYLNVEKEEEIKYLSYDDLEGKK